MSERIDLCTLRLCTIPEETAVPEPFRDFFHDTASFFRTCLSGNFGKGNLELYRDILPENYESSWGNPVFAEKMLGTEYGRIFSAMYAELRGIIPCIFEGDEEGEAVLLELFLETYTAFSEEDLPTPAQTKAIFASSLNDYLEDHAAERLDTLLNPADDFARKIIEEADFSDDSYLDCFGEYVTEDTRKTAAYLASLPQETIDRLAACTAKGYLEGFLDKDLIRRKKAYQIRFELGFERFVRAVIREMEKYGFEPTIERCASRLTDRLRPRRVGYFGAVPNRQFDYDHRNDLALLLDEDFVSHYLRAMRNAFEERKKLSAGYAGPLCLETFGEEPFVPVSREDGLDYSKKQKELYAGLRSESMQIADRYLPGAESTFTIIALPVPAIGPHFPEIFADTVKINTLDSEKYGRIQQKIIDALDTGVKVHVLGRGQNRTDLTVALHPLQDPAKETIFENCVADVNIPVGEVFTSPCLQGTNGILHVTHVFLEEYDFRDLELTLKDGWISDYGCRNFADENENRKYIEDSILLRHPSVPIGEFAIGTNTAAYAMMRKYGIEERMPILIAEKTGPHFAMGDTCYSFQEDTAVYNPDGKEIIARDNEASLLRKTDPAKAYFGCHTDITIPYDELGSICVIDKDGNETDIIRGGRFVLPGTEELNEPLLALEKELKKA